MKRVKGLCSAGKYIPNGKDPKIEIKHTFSKNMQSKFGQMFYEVWATLTQNFYYVRFHGVDWKAKRDYYAGFLLDLRL